MKNELTYDTQDLWEKDRDHIIHPWIDLGTARTREPLIVAEAEGAYVTNSEGHRMLDGMGGMWCVNVGYGREEMAQAIADQARRMCYFSPFGMISTPPSIEFGAKLAEYAPGDLRHVFFTTGGSTAVDSAIRFVQFYFNFVGQPEKKHIITREHAYHGSTYLTASVSGKPGDRGNLNFVTDIVHHLPAPNPYRRPDGMSEAEFCDAKVADLESKILELGPENVACFIAEPILASGGVIVPPEGYHRRTLEVCRKYDVLYISDEVVTGFGRLGQVFASEPVFDLVPDIITCAKGLTSGYVPLGAVMISDRLYGRLTGPEAEGKMFANGFTYSAHPVACAAGLKSLEIIEKEDLCGHVREIGPYFVERLRSLLDLPIVGDVRGSHLMVCIEYVTDKKTKEPMPAEWDIGQRIINETMPRGLLVRPMGHLVVMSPPLIITRVQIDELVETLRASTLAVMDRLVKEGLWRG
ncbi:aminotransferase [Rhodospirillaceae bacterium SYSU D60014]|uniref:aminotransferase n=1 Tax=Virgifigura deserti TaxID=2268457 RepID=UPI000E66C46C